MAVSGKTPRIISWARSELPEGMVTHGVTADVRAFAQLLRDTCAHAVPRPIRPHRVVFTLPDRFTYSRVISVPVGSSRTDIVKLVRDDAEGFVPFPLKEVTIDVTEAMKHDEGMSVFYSAVPTAILEHLRLLASEADMKLVGVDPETLSLGRLAVPPGAVNAWGVLDIGTHVSSLALYVNGALRRTATFSFGGAQCTNALLEELHLTREEAENKKQSVGVLGKGEVQAVLLGELKAFFIEVVRSIEECENVAQTKITDIFLSGGGSMMPGLIEVAGEKWKKTVRPLAPDFVARTKMKDQFPLFAAATGAAISFRTSPIPRLSFNGLLHKKNAPKAPLRTPTPTTQKKSTLLWARLRGQKRSVFLMLGLAVAMVVLLGVWAGKTYLVPGPTTAPVPSAEQVVDVEILVRLGAAGGGDAIRGRSLVTDQLIPLSEELSTSEQGLSDFEQAKQKAVEQAMQEWRKTVQGDEILLEQPLSVELLQEPTPTDSDVIEETPAPQSVLIRVNGLALSRELLDEKVRQQSATTGVEVLAGSRAVDWNLTIARWDAKESVVLLRVQTVFE